MGKALIGDDEMHAGEGTFSGGEVYGNQDPEPSWPNGCDSQSGQFRQRCDGASCDVQTGAMQGLKHPCQHPCRRTGSSLQRITGVQASRLKKRSQPGPGVVLRTCA